MAPAPWGGVRLEAEHSEPTGRLDGWTEGLCEASFTQETAISRKSERLIVQCKRWTARFVGPDVVREFAGTHPARGDLTGRLLLTLSDFTDDARTAARRAGVDLVDGSELGLRLQAVRRSEPCEQCGAPMVLDRSIGGWWLRCPRFREGCAGKKDLSRDPGRAVDLLLAQPHQH